MDNFHLVVHLLEEGGDPRCGHEGRPPGDALADVPHGGAVLVRQVVTQPEVGEGGAAPGEVANLVRLDLRDVLRRFGYKINWSVLFSKTKTLM